MTTCHHISYRPRPDSSASPIRRSRTIKEDGLFLSRNHKTCLLLLPASVAHLSSLILPVTATHHDTTPSINHHISKRNPHPAPSSATHSPQPNPTPVQPGPAKERSEHCPSRQPHIHETASPRSGTAPKPHPSQSDSTMGLLSYTTTRSKAGKWCGRDRDDMKNIPRPHSQFELK